MSTVQRSSVVCLALGRIMLDSRYLLSADLKRYRRDGVRVWGPPGEAIETVPSEVAAIGRLFDAKSTESSAELRFSIPEMNLPDASQWFARRNPNESLAHDLIVRHLANEWHENVPFLLHPGLYQAGIEYVGWSKITVSEPRPGPHPIHKTHYFARIFALTPPEKAVGAIMRALKEPNSPLTLVAPNEILAGRTAQGEKITPLAQFLHLDI